MLHDLLAAQRLVGRFFIHCSASAPASILRISVWRTRSSTSPTSLGMTCGWSSAPHVVFAGTSPVTTVGGMERCDMGDLGLSFGDSRRADC